MGTAKFFLAAFCLSFFPCRPQAAVLINEFVYDPQGADTGNEWIELYNTAPSTVSLEGWTIQTDDNAFPGSVKASLCGSIAPRSFYLIKESETAASTASTADLISGTIAMGNAGSKSDGLQLLDAQGRILDRVVYGTPDSDGLCEGSCSTAPKASNGASVARSSPGASSFISVPAQAVTPAGGGGTSCLSRSCPPGSGLILGFLEEVAPSIPSGDFAEIFLTGATDLCGAGLREGDTLIKTFPSATPNSGPFGPRVLFHASQRVSPETPDETDESGDLNGNGAIDLFSDESSPGLSGSVNDNLTLTRSDGGIADFVSWSVRSDDTYDAAKQSAWDLAASAGLWQPPCAGLGDACYESGSVPWFNRSSESMVRRLGTVGTLDAAPYRAEHWVLGTPSPGSGGNVPLRPRGRTFKVFQSPFSPLGGGRFTEAAVSYEAAPGDRVTIEIFDVQGRWMAALLDRTLWEEGSSGVLTWQGKDQQGRPVPAGIYLVRLDLLGADGSRERGIRTVVVGRRLQ